MDILVACEESQRVCKAFREKGHKAFSCDIIDTSGEHPEWHIKQDVLPLLNGFCDFTTTDGTEHRLNKKWDMIIAFPPCTFLTASGAVRLYVKKGVINPERYEKGVEAAKFFKTILNADCEKIVVENPTPMKVFELPKYNQVIEPFMFGHPYKKRTCLWLKGVPQLTPTEIVTPTPLPTVAPLKDVYAENFKIGVALNPNTIGASYQSEILTHFNSVTCENEMKTDAVLDQANSKAGVYEDPAYVAVKLTEVKKLWSFVKKTICRSDTIPWYGIIRHRNGFSMKTMM